MPSLPLPCDKRLYPSLLLRSRRMAADVFGGLGVEHDRQIVIAFFVKIEVDLLDSLINSLVHIATTGINGLAQRFRDLAYVLDHPGRQLGGELARSAVDLRQNRFNIEVEHLLQRHHPRMAD